ncbi:MAG: response regulator [Thiogranum sp.]
MSEHADNEEVKQVSAHDPGIVHKLVETLYENSGSALIGSMLAVAILTVIFVGHVSSGALVVWGGYMLAVTLGRYSLVRNYKSATSVTESSNTWAAYFYAGVLMNSLGWGAAVWVLFSPDAVLQAIFYITLAGIMAAGVVALAARHVAVICFLVPVTILGLSRLLIVNETTHFSLAAMLLIFSVFLYRFAKMSEHTLIDSLKLRYENKNLLEYLETSNEQLRDTTQKYIQLNTELTKMRDEALGLARAKSEFLATMSHEIRTPMNGVLGMIELLLGTRLSEQQQRFAETVRRSGEALLSIINNILDFSKIEAGKLSLEQADFNLRDLVEDLGDLFSARAHAKDLELACNVPGNIPEAMVGDATRLRQVLTNLIGNAIKFTETGEVLISVQSLEETATAVRVRFAIKDTGIGLEPSQVEHIFDSFSQADGSTTRKYGGTGLGLAISRQLVGLMGGQLGVESVAGQGSTFSFELELEKQQTPRSMSPARPANDFSKLHVLVVDDNATNLEILSHHLETWNIRHSCVESGASALQLLHAEVASNNPYNMVILDYHMPEMDGLELAGKISTDPLLARTRMVMFSSVDDVVLQQNSFDLGIDYSITKPVRQSELYDCLINRSVSDYRSTDHDTNDEYPLLVPTSDLESMQILVVEDNEVNQAVAIGMLKKLGYRGMHTANNGREALEKVEQTHYDLILMDMQMPVMDGYQATTALREREQSLSVATDGAANPHTPVVALTANALEGDRECCLEAGADDYLSKPFSPMDLGKLLEKWLPQTGTRNASTSSRGELTEAEPTSPVPVQGDEPAMELSAPPIDQSVLDVIRDMEDEDDPDMLADIIGLYRDKSVKLLQSLQTAIANMDAEAMRVAAHTLKSSSANVGARVLADLCRELEELGRSGSLDNAATKLSHLYDEYRRVDVALSDEIKGNVA